MPITPLGFRHPANLFATSMSHLAAPTNPAAAQREMRLPVHLRLVPQATPTLSTQFTLCRPPAPRTRRAPVARASRPSAPTSLTPPRRTASPGGPTAKPGAQTRAHRTRAERPGRTVVTFQVQGRSRRRPPLPRNYRALPLAPYRNLPIRAHSTLLSSEFKEGLWAVPSRRHPSVTFANTPVPTASVSVLTALTGAIAQK